MRFARNLFAPVLCLMIVASASTGAADVDKAKLIGAWEMVLPEDAKGLDLKIVIEFGNDGKATMSMDGFGKKESKGGTWKLEGDKLTITPKDEKEKTETITIKSLTADKMTLADKSGKDISFKKKAASPAKNPVSFEPETLVVFARELNAADIDLKLLMGKWAIPGQKGEVEFGKDGKLTLMVEGIKIEGKYKTDKDKLTIVMDFGGKEQTETITVKSISADKMLTVDSKGKEEELKRAK